MLKFLNTLIVRGHYSNVPPFHTFCRLPIAHTQNARLSDSCQKHCQSDNFMVVTGKVVKVVNVDNQKVVTLTTLIKTDIVILTTLTTI